MSLAALDTSRPRRSRDGVHGGVLLAALAVLSFGAAGCGSDGTTGEGDGASVPIQTTPSADEEADLVEVGREMATSTVPATAATSAAPSVVATTSTVVPATTSPPDPTATSAPLPTTPYRVPMADPGAAGWGDGHSGYPATDIFAACGAEIVSPVNGVATEVRTVDSWEAGVDNPATRGGRSVTIVGDDGVRYYFAHFDEIDGNVIVGDRILAGERLGTVGLTGRTSGCHLHFAISPPCPGKEWSVRRGVIPPKPYLDAWRDGLQPSPLAEVLQWSNDNPGACEEAMSDPFAQDA